MQLIECEAPLDFNIFDMGDRHKGARLHDDDGWNAAVEMIHSPYEGCTENRVFLKGDDIESILVDDPRYDFTSIESRTLDQMQACKKETAVISKKVDCWLTGNHEFKLQKFGEITRHMADELGVRYGTFAAKVTYKHKGKPFFKSYITHGAGSISSVADDEVRRRANMQLSLKRKLQRKAGDCHYMSMGHAHKLLTCPPSKTLYLIDDGKKLRQQYTAPPKGCIGFIPPDLRWYGCSGSFLKNQGIDFSGYAERAMYDPVEIGFLVLMIRGGQLVNVREEKI